MSTPEPTGAVSSVASGRRASFVANSVVAARFLPVWLATGVLIVVAAIIAPAALQHTNWAFVLPYMTILAIAALGQMLVIMQAGIDLSTPGVVTLGAMQPDGTFRASEVLAKHDETYMPKAVAEALKKSGH